MLCYLPGAQKLRDPGRFGALSPAGYSGTLLPTEWALYTCFSLVFADCQGQPESMCGFYLNGASHHGS